MLLIAVSLCLHNKHDGPYFEILKPTNSRMNKGSREKKVLNPPSSLELRGHIQENSFFSIFKKSYFFLVAKPFIPPLLEGATNKKNFFAASLTENQQIITPKTHRGCISLGGGIWFSLKPST